MIFFKLPNAGYVFFMVTFPLAISFSLGAILGTALSFGILFFSNLRSFLRKKKVLELIFATVLLVAAGIIILFILYPGNPLYLRIRNIFEGTDTSFKGRSFDSFHLALSVAREKSIYFGVGLGQLKLLGADIWNSFYNTVFNISQIAIPNAVAETFAIYGIAGLLIRFGLEWYLFIRTKTYNNYYRLGLFIYIFIYQFTGSYLFNIAEYVIWAFAFSGVFEEFDKKNILKYPHI
jgi:F0F1-type ATP synthase membrane subunit c/vacuolar-type H+-ATPase subunit K